MSNTKFLPADVKQNAGTKLTRIANNILDIAKGIENMRDDEILCALGANENSLKMLIDDLESHEDPTL